jgi:myo-inositol-1(or 4)-monophosphatase
MKLTQIDLFLLCQCAISAAYQAGSLITNYAGKQLDIKNKAEGKSLASAVVTEVDYLSQDLILKTIHPTCDIYDLGLLTEEGVDDNSRFEKDYFWCIDPLDGTLPFSESKPGYAVSIALVSKNGVSEIGVVYDPVKKNLYHAIKGNGTFKNGCELKINTQMESKNNILSVFFDRSFFKGELYKATEIEISRLVKEAGFKELKISQAGGSVISAINVVENAPACYFKYPRPEDSGGSLWDYAATSCIFNELVLIATDIYGQSMELNRSASTYMNHKGFVFASDKNLAEKIKIVFDKITNE